MAAARFKDLCIDVGDAGRLQTFWAAALGLEPARSADGNTYLREPGGGLVLWLNEVPEPRTVKHRVHLDLHCTDVQDLLDLGATVVREPTEQDRWWSLADPEGGELCAFVRESLPAHRLYEIVVDSADPLAQARWWQDVLGGEVEPAADPSQEASIERVPGLAADYLVFGRVPEPKTVKNRVHWDVTADSVDELVRRGARVLREPTARDDWHVLADPEGNEFCAFAPR